MDAKKIRELKVIIESPIVDFVVEDGNINYERHEIDIDIFLELLEFIDNNFEEK